MLTGALKAEKGSAVKPCLLPPDGTPFPVVASVTGYRCLQLGPGIRESCGLTHVPDARNAKKKGAVL